MVLPSPHIKSTFQRNIPWSNFLYIILTCSHKPIAGPRSGLLKSCLGNPLRQDPPPPPTTLIPHIEVGFKWMWTQLATQNKMAPVFVNLCAGLVVLLPRQIRRFRHGFFSSAVLDWSLRSCLRVRHLWRQQIADNRRYLRRSFLPEHRHYEVKSRCRSAGNATMVNLLTKQYQTSSLSPPWVRNLDFEKSL